MKKTFISAVILLLCYLTALTQQYPLFTNYVLNDFGFNPAVAGSTPWLDSRLMYRRQWLGLTDAPQTGIFSIHAPLGNAGLGTYAFNDEAGKIRRTGAALAFTYGLPLDAARRNVIRFGISGNFQHFRLKISDATTIDPLLSNGQAGRWVADFQAGIFAQFSGLYVGFSAPQLLGQKFRFSAQPDASDLNLLPHYYGMLGFYQPLGPKISIEPSILVKYYEYAPIQFELNLKTWFNRRFWIGGGYRHLESAVGMVGFEIGQGLSVAYAYDYALTAIREASTGSHEIVVGFKIGRRNDRDGDGLADDHDDCPDEPGSYENKGCPKRRFNEMASTDTDGDGIPDATDRCPQVPGSSLNHGCPFADRDNDGIRDDLDRCPDVFGYTANDGCPINDRDRDGIVDEKDKCPDEPGAMAYGGCPELDSDGDGVADIYDHCPKTPGDKESHGCPTASDAEKEILNLAIRNLYFDTGKSDIKPESYPYLDKLAELLVRHKNWKIRLAGHADSRGPADFNLNLSKRRAEAVMYYLVNRGVNRERLVIEYFGANVPAASNASENTRYLNRRVEMNFVWD